jgi:hypothetical protein
MSDCRFGKGKRAISSSNLPIDNHPITKFSVYPHAVPDRKKTTMIQPMTNAAAMSMRILAFLERDMRNLELTIVDCEIVRSQLGKTNKYEDISDCAPSTSRRYYRAHDTATDGFDCSVCRKIPTNVRTVNRLLMVIRELTQGNIMLYRYER